MTTSDSQNPVARGAKLVAAVYVVFALVVMTYTNCAGFPDLSPRESVVTPTTAEPTVDEATPADGAEASVTVVSNAVPGVAYVDALLYIYENAISKSMVGWLPNDRVYPTIFLDNVENFQLGTLEGLRYAVRVLRDDLSRLRTTDSIDADVDKAFTQFSIDVKSWLLPPAEREYAQGAKALRRYRQRLIDGQAHFYPRADNLVDILDQLNSLLGGTNNRLLNTIPDLRDRLSEETTGDATLSGEKLVSLETKWSETDDRFYYARGVSFVYREIMKAVLVDFDDVLSTWKASETANTIVRDFLDHAQFDPLYVANGSLGSMWPNHPYQLLGLLSQARERARSLRSIVTPGSSG